MEFLLTFADANNQNQTTMLLYNTTFTMPNDDARNFVIWVHQALFPRVAESGLMQSPRLLRILSHKDEQTECFSVQFEVADSATLHRWYTQQGSAMMQEMVKVFDGRVAGFSTMMEVID